VGIQLEETCEASRGGNSSGEKNTELQRLRTKVIKLEKVEIKLVIQAKLA
jgi:hypothetical protein